MAIVVGPVIGEVTQSSARILVEVDSAIALTCVLTPESSSFGPVNVTVQLSAGIPGVFKFSSLPPATLFSISFSSSQVKNAADRTGSFKTLPLDARNLTVISLSCNSLGEPEEPVVWDDLIEKYIKPKRADLVLHVGDQVYADAAFHAGVKLAKDAKEKGTRSPDNIKLKHDICELYRDFYRRTWNYAPTRFVLSHVPNLTIWDDHDIRDDWGSHDTDFDPVTNEYYVGLCARQVYWEYQRQLWDDVFQRDIETIRTDCHFHKFGSIGILFADNRGCRSFYRDSKKPFLSEAQWDAINHALFAGDGIFGPQSGVKALLVTMSTALVCAGPSLSKVGAGVMKDKMGWGLNPHEQLDFIKAIHKWKMGNIDDASLISPLGREVVVIGGDLHIAIRSEIRYQGQVIFEQLITSAIRQHAPPQVGQIALKSLMNTSEKLKDGYSFRHNFFKPRRNFGVFSLQVREDTRSSTVQSHFFYRNKKGQPYKKNSKFDEGDLVISNIRGESLVAKDSNGTSDPYMKFKILGVKRRLHPIKKSLNPSWGSDVSIRIPIAAFNYKHGSGVEDDTTLRVEVWDWDRGSKDDFMGTVAIPLSSLLAHHDDQDAAREMVVSKQQLEARSKSDRVAGSVSFNLAFVPYH